MKAKFYTGIISALLLAGSPVAAQFADDGFRNGNSGQVINNYYYNDYDYYFASRINRFHRSYTAFNYYSPVFTETYYYNYRPFSWGISIYGGGGFGFGMGYSYRYPVYRYGWYDPYYGADWYWDYDPYYYSYDPYYYSWYSPVVININVVHRWRPHYQGWYGYNSWYYGHNHWYYNYRPVYHTHQYHYYNYNTPTRYSSREIPERKGSGEFNRSGSGVQARREGAPVPGSRGVTHNKSNPSYDPGKARVAPSYVQSGRRIETTTPARSQPNTRVTTPQTVRTQSSTVSSAQARTSSPSGSRTAMSPGRPSSSSKGTSVSGSRSSSSNSESRSSGSSSRSSSSRSSSDNGSRR